jgi:hypothetical protein
LNEVSKDIVLLAVIDPQRALELLLVKRHVPDYIIVDLANSSLRTEVFFDALEEDLALAHIPLVVYGEFSQLTTMRHDRITAYLENDSAYSKLKNSLGKILKP